MSGTDKTSAVVAIAAVSFLVFMSTSLLLGRRLVAGALRMERSTSQNLPGVPCPAAQPVGS